MILLTFFIIVFIAEIIVTCRIVGWLRNLDKQVCSSNLRLNVLRRSLEKNLCAARIKINNFHLKINEKLLKIARKKAEIKRKLLKHLISTILITFLKNYKQGILYWLEIIFALFDLLDSWKRNYSAGKQISS